MMKNPASHLGFVAACFMAIGGLATSQQVQAGPFGSSDRPQAKHNPSGGIFDKLSQNPKTPMNKPFFQEGNSNTVQPPAQKQARPDTPGSRPGKQGHRLEGMAAGVLGGLALGAMMSQAQARPQHASGSMCYFERRRVWDEFGNPFYRKVRICEE